nr:clustered mitochondria protein [Tanacetum cinerariifolium]GEX40661.1 clustered mitochondria protein [Tanacetum cinerariifolium]
RFNTTAENPIKEIILQLNLPDHRVVGSRAMPQNHCVLSGILQGDKSDSLLYGSISGKKICWNEDVHAKRFSANKRSDVKLYYAARNLHGMSYQDQMNFPYRTNCCAIGSDCIGYTYARLMMDLEMQHESWGTKMTIPPSKKK